MDKNYTKYSHPANVVHVSSTFSGDMLKKYQYYNDLQTAINEAPINSTVICFDSYQAFTTRSGIKVTFARSGGSMIWQGIIAQDSSDPPVLQSILRNDFGIGLHFNEPFLYSAPGRYSIRFAKAIVTSATQLRIENNILCSLGGGITGFLIGAAEGTSSSTIPFGTIDSADLSTYSDDLIDATGTILTVVANV